MTYNSPLSNTVTRNLSSRAQTISLIGNDGRNWTSFCSGNAYLIFHFFFKWNEKGKKILNKSTIIVPFAKPQAYPSPEFE